MLDLIRTFRADEDGAVTVDWVVLTAAVVGLGIAVSASLKTGTTAMATDIGKNLDNATVPMIPFNG